MERFEVDLKGSPNWSMVRTAEIGTLVNLAVLEAPVVRMKSFPQYPYHYTMFSNVGALMRGARNTQFLGSSKVSERRISSRAEIS